MGRTFLLPLLAVLALCAMPQAPLRAQAQGDWFPFPQPWNDTLREDASLRFFPQFPRGRAGEQGFLQVDSGGHFRFEGAQAPTRFVGVNFSYGASMADSAVILQVAGRLAKYGVNVVRMHHMDSYAWWDGRETLLDIPAQGADTRHLNPAQLRRLSFTIAALAEQGIYSNINLHVSRSFQAADGVAHADSLPDYGKVISMFDPRIRMLMKEHARNLLSTVNPYTGLRFADDPRIAFVEITNENSLYTGWMWGALNHRPGDAGTLSCFHSHPLECVWCAWLRARHASTAALRDAWRAGTGGSLADRTRNGGFEDTLGTEWRLEVHTWEGAAAALRRAPEARSGAYAARIDIDTATGTSWHVQCKQVGCLRVERDSQYTVSFSARASHPRAISVSLGKDVADYDNYGLSRSVALGTDWTSYALSFRATGTDSATTRLSFILGQDSGVVWLDDVRFTALDQAGLEDDESLEACSVRRVAGNDALAVTIPRLRETAEFMIALEKDFFDDMHAFLRDSVGVRCPIAGSNWYAGLGDLAAQSGMDYIDAHAYWQHPQFPHTPWDASDWLIPNTAMTADTALGTMPRLSALAVAGKPFVVSEYNHPAPSWYQSEMLPQLIAYASLQDWDAVYLYSYHHGYDDWNHGRINGFFDIDGNPLAMALLPQAASIFRNGLIKPAEREIALRFSREDLLAEAALPHGALFFSGLPDATPLLHRVRVADMNAPATPSAASYGVSEPLPPYRSDTQEITWDPEQTLLKLDVPPTSSGTVQGCTGRIPPDPVMLIDMTAAGDGSFATVLYGGIPRNYGLLLTILGRAENTGMAWDGTTTVHNHWGMTPPLLEPHRMTLTFYHGGNRGRVYLLDSLGRASGYFLSTKNTPYGVEVTIDPAVSKTPWFGIDLWWVDGAEAAAAPASPSLSCYPIPADDALSVEVALPAATALRLALYDMLGRCAASIDEPAATAGIARFRLSVRNLPSGMYILRATGEKTALATPVMVAHR